MPGFFVPLVEPGDEEAAYVAIAHAIGAVPHNVGERIYSITWKHRHTVWTANVGEQLTGKEIVSLGKGKAKTDREVVRSTSDTVLAIFSGVPFLIAHDNKSGVWNVPILTRLPTRIARFTS